LSRGSIRPGFTRESMRPTAAMYLGDQNPNQELLTPATLADLTGFPPLLLPVGANEVLLDDSTRLADRARAAGVDVILDATADVPHVFQSFVGQLDEADQAFDRAALFLRQHAPQPARKATRSRITHRMSGSDVWKVESSGGGVAGHVIVDALRCSLEHSSGRLKLRHIDALH